MSAPGKRRGRPPKFTTDEERKAAKQKTKKESYQRQRDRQKNTPYQQELQHQQDNVATAPGLQIQLDPLSILQQTGPKEDRLTTVPDEQITAPDRAILAEEDNKGADTEEGAQWQLAERVRSTASTQSLSLVRESPLPQLAQLLEPVPLLQDEDSAENADWVRETGETSGIAKVLPSEGIQLSNEADDIDWAAHSNNDYTDNASNSDDGPEDRRARQAGSNEPTANDGDGEVEQEQHTKAAASQLQMAWNKRCTCGM
jgi:hypothetical protein